MLNYTKVTIIYIECNDIIWDNLMYWFLAKGHLDDMTVPGREMEDLLTYLKKVDTWKHLEELEKLFNRNLFADFTFYHYSQPMWVKTNYAEGWD